MPGKYYVIAGYIGEKNSRLQLYLVDPEEELVDGRPPPGELKHDQTFRNHEYGTFIQVVETFLGQCYRGALPTVTCACFAVAGPVDANHVTFSNRSNWVIDGHMLERHLRFKRIELINDFVSAGYGFLTLREDESVTLQEAPVLQGAPIAGVGAGTGLGEVYLTYNNGNYTAWPSEGGHCEFAPRTQLEIELLQFLKSKFNEDFRVSVERIVSNRGLSNVYEFLSQHKQYGPKITPEAVTRDPTMPRHAVRRAIEAAPSQAVKEVLIQEHAAYDEVCNMAMEIMISTYGAEAGCAALKWLPYGGLYICGRFAMNNIKRLQETPTFMAAYQDKGRVSPIIRQVPVKVIMVADIVDRGATYLANKMLREMLEDERSANSITVNRDSALAGLAILALATTAGVVWARWR